MLDPRACGGACGALWLATTALSAINLNHVRAGEGPPLVLIHGLGGANATWEPVIDRLAAERDVIALDMPGFGGSGPLPDGVPYSAVEMGHAIAEFLAGLGIDRPHLAGNSLGAWTALEMAADGAAASVCGISPAGLWRRPLGPRRYDTRRIGRLVRPLIVAAVRSAPGRRALMGTTVAKPENLTSRQAASWVAGWLDAPAYDAANGCMRTLVFERRDEVDVPVTIAWGDHDRLVRPPRPERMPVQTRYLVGEGWGHTPTADDPDGVARLLLEASSAAGAVPDAAQPAIRRP